MPLDRVEMRRLRVARGLTQQEAANASGLSSRQAWQRIEDGTAANITVSTLDAIAASLSVEPTELLTSIDVRHSTQRAISFVRTKVIRDLIARDPDKFWRMLGLTNPARSHHYGRDASSNRIKGHLMTKADAIAQLSRDVAKQIGLGVAAIPRLEKALQDGLADWLEPLKVEEISMEIPEVTLTEDDFRVMDDVPPASAKLPRRKGSRRPPPQE